ncbi:IclR family transcriptional regulator [Bradyrhizobium vignae]|uniref:IclR family transcriptional regulator n=1 Tax=Bradyrhizobium vignae TaxID=1549949 RepID=UPI00100A9F9A|nr:IclR family transcriptional regulator [Bradyrhizobium vignae]RXG88512.1 IclR family transcriptional regulator [Bradyrhizobium vignae]
MTRDGAESVERALNILRAFSETRREMSLTEISQSTGLYKSTVLRLTASLEACGFLQRGEDKLYRLGPELWRLGAIYRRGLDLGEFIRPVLRRLVDTTQESVSFYVRDGDERICLYRQNSPRAVRHHLEEGERLPLDRGAAGRVLRAYTAPKWPPGAQIREDGFYISLGERDADVAAASVPVIDNAGRLRGALSVSGLRSRFDTKAQHLAIEAMKMEAARLADHLPASD